MHATSAFLVGYVTFLPLLVIQFLLARGAVRRWPKTRYAMAAAFSLIFLHSMLGFPWLHGRVRLPTWLAFGIGWWTYASSAAFLCYWAVRMAGSLTFARRDTDPKRRQMLQTAAYAAAAIPAGVLLYGCAVERDQFRVEEVSVPIPDLHPDLEGFRVLQLSDVHRSAFLSQKQLARVVDACRELKPDLIAHTGDFISGRGDPLEACIDELARLHSNVPAFGCLGNHEIYADAEAAATEYAERRGIRILRAANATLRHGNATLNIAGVDYQQMSHRDRYLRGNEDLVAPGSFNMLLSHNPDVFRKSAAMGFDLTLSGHTHGGQIRAEILHADVDLARFYTPYVAGLYRAGSRLCYVTRGIGSIGIPARIGAPPEITLLRFTRA